MRLVLPALVAVLHCLPDLPNYWRTLSKPPVRHFLLRRFDVAFIHPFAKFPHLPFREVTSKRYRPRLVGGHTTKQAWEEPSLPSTDVLVSALLSARPLDSFVRSDEADNPVS